MPTKVKTDALAPTAEPSIVRTEALGLHAIETTIQRVETVRKYISKHLNAGYQRLEKQIKKSGKPSTELEKKRLKELEIDYGTIPGVNKKFLLQPGAEKICQWLHIRPVYENSTEKIDGHAGHIDVVCRCRLVIVAGGEEVFSGPMASCTTMESNYRFRWVKMDPQPTKDWAFGEGKMAKSLGTHRCFPAYKNGVKTGDWEWSERRENPNIYDELNKVRQMAEKRALVKAVRNFGALSEIFTEDPSEWVLESETEAIVPEEPPKPGVVVRDEPPPKVEPVLQILWPADTSEVAIVRLPEGPEGLALIDLVRDCADFMKDTGNWVVPAIHIAPLAEKAKSLGCTVSEKDAEKPEKAPEPIAPAAPLPPNEPAPTKGKVTLVKKEAGRGKGGDYYLVIMAGRSFYCYSKSLHQYIATKALGQECEFDIADGAYPKIIGIRKLGSMLFDDDGMPVLG